MKRYKVLISGKISPYKKMKYVSGKEYVCANFDADISVDCSTGYYATDLDGLCFAYRPGMSIYECDVAGQSVEYNQFKMRYERFVLGRKLSRAEVISRMRSRAWDWDVEHATFPVDPFKIRRTRVTRREIELCETWTSVWASVGASVGASVRDSVGDSVGVSVGDSVGDSVGAYNGSLFTGIKKWKYCENIKEKGYPFQSCVDLWKKGLIAVKKEDEWILLGSPKGDGKCEILWKGKI